MSKFIKTTNTEMKIKASIILAVRIGNYSFEKDENYPWINLFYINSEEEKQYIDFIDEDDMPILTDLEELKVFALNWYFNNVEIIQGPKNNG